MRNSANTATVSSPGDEQHGQYLTFRLGDETYAMPILSIKEILEFGNLTPVPLMPACIRGVLNLRGSVVPVVDLAVRFGRTPTVASRRTCIVILEVTGPDGSQDIGVIVDGVNQVIEIRRDEIEPAPAFGARLRTDFIACMGKIDDQFVVILDCEHVLSVDEMAQLVQTGAPQEAAA